MKYVILIGLILLVLVEYAVCCISHDADEGAERRYKERRDETNRR